MVAQGCYAVLYRVWREFGLTHFQVFLTFLFSRVTVIRVSLNWNLKQIETVACSHFSSPSSFILDSGKGREMGRRGRKDGEVII